MDDSAAVAFLNEFLGCLNESKTIYDGDYERYYQHRRWAPLQEQINALLVGVRRIAEAVEPGLMNDLMCHSEMYTWEWERARDATHQLRGAIEQSERVDAILAPRGPKIAARNLHPWAWDAAAQLWDDGHLRAALQTAASAIDSQLQAKLDRFDVSGADLVTQAFTLTGEGKRLRFADIAVGSESYRSAHEGALHFGRGCFQGIRNRVSHDDGELDEQVALEQLAALSVLARWVDRAEVVVQ